LLGPGVVDNRDIWAAPTTRSSCGGVRIELGDVEAHVAAVRGSSARAAA